MEECFLLMVDRRTGIDMIPHVLYNLGIHGATVAKMPLIATRSEYRWQGMYRHLMNAIEEMLRSLKVEKLVISAIPSLVETWKVGFGFGFGFGLLDDNERQCLSTVNLMVFPGTAWLKKSYFVDQVAEEQHLGSCHADQITELNQELSLKKGT